MKKLYVIFVFLFFSYSTLSSFEDFEGKKSHRKGCHKEIVDECDCNDANRLIRLKASVVSDQYPVGPDGIAYIPFSFARWVCLTSDLPSLPSGRLQPCCDGIYSVRKESFIEVTNNNQTNEIQIFFRTLNRIDQQIGSLKPGMSGEFHPLSLTEPLLVQDPCFSFYYIYFIRGVEFNHPVTVISGELNVIGSVDESCSPENLESSCCDCAI